MRAIRYKLAGWILVAFTVVIPDDCVAMIAPKRLVSSLVKDEVV